MSDEELEAYIKTIDPNFDSHLEKGTIEMSNEYYNLLEEKMARIINKNKELKKQFEEKENNACNWKDSCLENAGKIEKLETQQKEFIEWLENENRKIYRDFGLRQNIFKQVLQKYKEIIGVSDENNKQ